MEAAAASAAFAFVDPNSQGNWWGQYGKQGSVVPGGSTNLPAYANLSFGGQSVVWSASASDTRAPLLPFGMQRVASAWYDMTSLTVDVQFTDAAYHRLGMYFLDWLNLGGSETVDVLDAVSGSVLDHRIVPPFTNGVYEFWDAKGHLVFHVTRAAGAPPMVSGLFFDSSPLLPPITITNPPSGSLLAAPAPIGVTAIASANANVSRVDFYQGAALVGSASNGPPYTFQWTNAPAGNLTILAREVSASYGTMDSTPVSFTVLASNTSVLVMPARRPGGTLQFSAQGPAGRTTRLEAATTLAPNAIWQPLQTNTFGASPIAFTVSDPTNFPQRFYRVVTLP
jgi:hypothetical protein